MVGLNTTVKNESSLVLLVPFLILNGEIRGFLCDCRVPDADGPVTVESLSELCSVWVRNCSRVCNDRWLFQVRGGGLGEQWLLGTGALRLPPAASAHVQPELAGHGAAAEQPVSVWSLGPALEVQEQRSSAAHATAGKHMGCRRFFGKKYRDSGFPWEEARWDVSATVAKGGGLKDHWLVLLLLALT